MDLVKLAIGADADVQVKFEGGCLVVVFSLQAKKEIEALIDKVEQLIPGDQTGIAAAVKALIEAQLK